MTPISTRRWLLTLGLLLLLAPAALPDEAEKPTSASPARPSANAGRTVVVWISIDGMRGDYVDTATTPFLQRLMKEGAYTRKLVPVFPSLTFPAHVSQVTGTGVDRHGIIGNAIFDLQNDRRWSYPNVASEVLSEPIWTTVKRGGPRVLVFDWPVSQQQQGPWKADYFDQSFDTGHSDKERLDRLMQAWSSDQDQVPLQLLMGYVGAVDKAGHQYGPDAPETRAAVEETDRLLGGFFTRVQQQFKERMRANDTLYFLLTTDHGMEAVKVIVNLRLLCGSAWNDEMRMLTSGSVGNIFLHRLGPPPARAPHVEKLLQVLKTSPFLRAYARKDLPEKWHYDHPSRTGDVVVSLDPGYFFSEKEGAAMRVVDEEGPLGMHGYAADECPNMHGFMAIWRSGRPLNGKDLGVVDCRRLHATVAQWLNVKPAENAVDKPLEFE